MNDAIQVDDLWKSYGNHTVLKGVSFRIAKGEIFAFLGVNGAGKTTLLECMEGLRKYDSGSIALEGKIGIQLQSSSLPGHIRTMEAVRLFAKWNKTRGDQAMLTALGIHEFSKKMYMELSTGQKRRLHLALALISNPDIVFLDEPTAGLDVEGRATLHDIIRKQRDKGKTILLASHDMAEVESLCDRIAILQEGRIAFSGTVLELGQKAGKHYMLHIQTDQGSESYETDHLTEKLLDLLENYKRKGICVLDLKIDRGTLEQHFLKIAKGEEA